MKIGVDTWSIHSQGWSDFEILDYYERIGVNVVHFASVWLLQSQDEGYLRELRQHADHLGLDIEAGMNSISPTSTMYHRDREGDIVQRVRDTLRMASILGAPVIKCFIGSGNERRTDVPLSTHMQGAVETLKAVRDQALDLGIKMAVENHGDLQSHEVRALIQAAGPDHVGSCFDAGNAIMLGEDLMTAFEHLAPFVVTSHIRDSVVFPHPKGACVQHVAMGHGNVGIDEFARAYQERCPQASFVLEVLTGSPPRVLDYLEPSYWEAFPDMPAREFARFERLVRRGQAYIGTMVAVAHSQAVPEAYHSALVAQERYDLKRSVAYCREVLGLGE